MIIHTFSLPALLETHLSSNSYRLSEKQTSKLKEMLTQIDSPRPKLWGYQQIVSQHSIWGSSKAANYLGTSFL